MAKRCSKFSGKNKDDYVLPAGPDGRRCGKGLVDLERMCQDTSRKIKMLNKRQDIFQNAIEGKLRVQDRLSERMQDQTDLWMYQNETEEAKRLQGVRKPRKDEETAWAPPRKNRNGQTGKRQQRW